MGALFRFSPALSLQLMAAVLQGAGSDSQEVAREAWVDLKGDMEHALPLAQPKLLKGIQLYFAELDVQSEPPFNIFIVLTYFLPCMCTLQTLACQLRTCGISDTAR